MPHAIETIVGDAHDEASLTRHDRARLSDIEVGHRKPRFVTKCTSANVKPASSALIYSHRPRPSAISQSGSGQESFSYSGIMPAEDQSGIGSAKTEAVRHHTVKLSVVDTTESDWHIGEGRVKLVDIGALSYETIVHHQQRENRLLNADGPQRMPR